jgi:hypothetical protein
MSSKKKHRKKQFKARSVTAPQAVTAPLAMPAAPVVPQAPAAVVATPQSTEETVRLRLIRRDIRRVAVLAGSFVALQLVLWYLFGHTSLGNSVYQLIKI